MRKTAFLFAVLLLLAQGARSEEFLGKVLISWEKPVLSDYSMTGNGIPSWLLNFRGAVFQDRTGSLPLFFEKLPLKNTSCSIDVSLEDETWEKLDLADTARPVMDSELLTGEFVVFHNIFYDRKHPYLAVYVLPLRISHNPENIERLTSAHLRVRVDYHAPDEENEVRHVDNLTESVLKEGDWYKIGIVKTGLYKISYQDLVGYGINPESIDPRDLQIYGNGGAMLEESTSRPRPDVASTRRIIFCFMQQDP